MIGIISALSIEAELLITSSETPDEVREISGIQFHKITLGGKSAVVAVCGVGKVNAARTAQAMIMAFSPEIIINTGVAGALNKELHICDIVVGEKTVQHDMDTSAIGDPVGLVSGINVVFFENDKFVADVICESAEKLGFAHRRGIIACGDRFVADSATKEKIVENFGADACEMESAAMAQACYINNVPFGVIRAISDGADDGANMDYPTFAKIAAEKGIALTDEFIKNI